MRGGRGAAPRGRCARAFAEGALLARPRVDRQLRKARALRKVVASPFGPSLRWCPQRGKLGTSASTMFPMLDRVRPQHTDEAEVREALAAVERGDEPMVTMTADEYVRWMTTGEGGPCPGSSDLDRGT